MTYLTEGQIKAAIDAWAEARVDASIAEQIESNKKYNQKTRDEEAERKKQTPWYTPRYFPETVEEFDREDEIYDLAEEFYNQYSVTEVELPGIGLAKFVDSYGGEGQGDDYWQVWEIDGKFYKADHYYSSYDTEPWHSNCTWFPVVGREKVVTEWVLPQS